MPAPLVTVVVPSHERSLRLRWLLNALEEQTLSRHAWRVIVVHDDHDEESEKLLTEHPLADAGTLTHVRLSAGTGSPSVQRNTGWRAATTALVAFTDDDCRPAAEWLEELCAVAEAHPGAIVQGTTLPDPYEIDLLRAPWHRTLEIHPPSPFAQTCNIAYPTDLLQRLRGFDQSYAAMSGEDTDLALRATRCGAAVVAAEGAVVYHAIEAYGLAGMLRLNWKWQHLAYVVRTHRDVRTTLVLGVFWRESHLRLLGAMVGVAFAPRTRFGLVLAVPYVGHLLSWHGKRPRGRARSVIEAPGRALVEMGELAACVRGSVRYRTLFL